jgi:WD40 repeat protein/uncharacterized caspase-like protein
MSPIGIGTSSKTQVERTTAKLWLLMVGVNQYQDNRLSSLRYAAVDCQGLSEALVEATGQFKDKDVKIFHTFSPQSPVLENVRSSFLDIVKAAKPQDTVLFYFSGHGMLEAIANQVVLCLNDTNTNDLLNTGFKLQEILQLLTKCAAQNQLLWLDACHSGAMSSGVSLDSSPNPTPQLVQALQVRASESKGFYALLSCDTNQQSWEFPELGHGVFTYYLMRGLQGEAADSQGLISADKLYRYVYHQTLQYIDKSNQQLRLINQQKKNKGEKQLYGEYPLQTPKRFVAGIGEVILGKRVEKTLENQSNRVALIIDGISGGVATLEIGKFLGKTGGFKLDYLPASRVNTDDVKEAITRYLQTQCETVLLHLRGRIEETEAWEGLVFGNEIRIKRSWLKQQLKNSSAKQILILDCPDLETSNVGSLEDWVEDLQIDSQQGQCLLAYASPCSQPEKFTQILLDTFKAASQLSGLSAAGLIAQLQLALAGGSNPLHVWLSGEQGIIEIISPLSPSIRTRDDFDLGICPYMGLTAFGEDNSQYFYGREGLILELVHHLRDRSFLAVVGASGSGKSSIVQAGVIPQLRQGKQIPNSESWFLKIIRPGVNPLGELANCFGRVTENKASKNQPSKNQTSKNPISKNPMFGNETSLMEGILNLGVESFVYWLRKQPQPITVLVIDQFEELFTLAPSTDREKFFELIFGALKYASDRFKVVITLRADFITSCLEVEVLADLLQEFSVLVPAKLSIDDYRRVIVNPAQQVGLKVEAELVEVLLRELNNSVGDLPLLEFVLEQLWQRRAQGKLTLEAYQKQLGGIQGALERSSQSLYESLNREEQECAKWIFLSLTQLGEGTEDTRRRIFKSDLIVQKYPVELVEKTLTALTTAKLIVLNLEESTVESVRGKGKQENHEFAINQSTSSISHSPITVEVAHEILIRHWSTLRWWLEENRDRLRKQRQIEQAAQLWLNGGMVSDFLFQGVRLVEAEDIYIKYIDELSPDIQKFIEACLEQRKQQQKQAEKRLRKERRGIAIISMLSVAIPGIAWLFYSQASINEGITALNSLSNSQLLLSHEQLEALSTSLQAGKNIKRSINIPNKIILDTKNNLNQILSKIQEYNRLEGHTDPVFKVIYSPDGQKIATASNDGTVKIWNTEGKLLNTLDNKHAIYAIAFSVNGQTLAAGDNDGKIQLWNIADGSLIKTLKAHQALINSLSFSPDGKILASASDDKTVKIWDVNSGLKKLDLTGHLEEVIGVSFSPDSKTIASASEDNTINIWDAINGRKLKNLTEHKDWVNSVSFSPDGKTLVSSSADKTIKLWDLNQGKKIKNLTGHENSVLAVTFSHDGTKIASASRDNTVKLWTADGRELDTFKGHTSGVYGVSFSLDDKTIASASLDKTVRLWRRNFDSPETNFEAHNKGIYAVAISHDDKMIATAGGDGKVLIWSRSSGSLIRTITAHNKIIYSLSFSVDSKNIITGSEDNTAKIWRISDSQLMVELKGHIDEINKVNFSPDGKKIATASRDSTVRLWKSNGDYITKIKGNKYNPENEIFDVAFSPDNKIIATASNDGYVKIYDAQKGNFIKDFLAHDKKWVYSIKFTPDSKNIVTSASDGSIKIWQVNNGKLLQTLAGHKSPVFSVAISPDGKLIASASEDKKVKIWQIDGTLLTTLPEHGATVYDVVFSHDGKNLISGSGDSQARLWRINPEDYKNQKLSFLIQRGCNWLGDYLKNNPNQRENKDICGK